ncbi:MAG: 5'-nucleotidase C-terminal domain-containing protein [Oceanospirillaceae bacterium]
MIIDKLTALSRKYSKSNVTIVNAFIISLFSCSLAASTTIVYTSNQPDILLEKEVAHFPQLGSLLQQIREDKNKSSLFLHGGDSFSPSAISLFDKARNIISLANIMDVSLYSAGKRELTYDVDVLSLRAHDAHFPIISSNMTDLRSNTAIEGLFSDYQFNIEGKSISIASIINPRMLISYAPKYAQLEDLDQALKKIVITQAASDIKILMTDLNKETAIALTDKYKFDLILVAIDGKDEIIIKNETTIVLGGGQDGDAAIIEIDYNAVQKVSARIEQLDKYPPNAAIVDFIEKYQKRLGSLYNEHIATAAAKFTTQKAQIRTRETALANVFVDALREHANAEIAILNSGSIRNSAIYPVGYKFTRGDIQREFPFGGYYVVIELSGAELLGMMENSVSRIEHIDGRFLNIAGMNAVYDSSAPIGARLRSLNITGKPVVKNKTYTMALQDFYLKGGDDYYMLKNKEPINNLLNKDRMWNIVSNYFSKQQIIGKPTMNRMVDQAKNEN